MEDFLPSQKQETFQEKIQRDALNATVKAIEAKITGLVCPTHQKSPRLKFSEDSGPGQQKMSFDCCCDTLAQMLQDTLKN